MPTDNRPPDVATNVLTDPADTSTDLELLGQAVRQGWEIDERVLELLPGRVATIAFNQPKSKDGKPPFETRDQLAAGRLLIAMLTQNGVLGAAGIAPGGGKGPVGAAVYQQFNFGSGGSAAVPWIVPTRKMVAQFFGLSEDTIKDWREKGMPGLPGTAGTPGAYNLAEILAWRDATIGPTGRNEGAAKSVSRAEAERQLAWTRLESARDELRKARLELVDPELLDRAYRRLQGTARALLEQLPDRMLGALPAKTTGDDKRRFRTAAEAAVGDICRAMQQEVSAAAEETLVAEAEKEEAGKTNHRGHGEHGGKSDGI